MTAASQHLTEARTYLERVLPWPPLGSPDAFLNIHYPSPGPQGGKPYWNGYAVETVDEAIRQIRYIMSSGKAIGDVYACMSSQRISDTKTAANGYTFRTAVRSQSGAVHLRSLFLDIDVKPSAYHDTREAMAALIEFCKATGLPRPSLAVQSGSGGLHVYWTLDEALTPAQWKPLAQALAEATRRHGLICDTACTVDSARILRVPGTFNFKTNPPKPVTMAITPGPDYSVGVIAAALGTKPVPKLALVAGTAFPNAAELNAAATAGIETSRPVILSTLRERCGFIKEAFDTGGAGFSEPLWHLSVLASVFDPDGLATAHALSQGHADYDPDTTAALYERKRKERELKGLGWPSCRAIEDAGCGHCATCPARAAGKSPLNLAERVTDEAPSTPAKLRAIGISDVPVSPPPRRWMHGTDLMKGVCTLLVSPGGKGKTAMLIGIALACASGEQIMGAKVFGGKQRVLYLNTEDGSEEIGRRIRAALRHHKLADADVAGLRLGGVDTARVTLLASERGNHRINAEAFAQFRSLIEEHRPDLIILDPLANLSAHTLNDNAAATALMAGLTGIAVEYDAAVLIAHHTGKGRDLTSQEAAMGAAALVNSARAVLSIDTLTGNDAGKIGVMPSDAPRYFRLISVKGNLSPPSSDDRWFELTSVALNNGTPEYPSGDNVQVVAPFKPRPAANVFPPGDVAAVLAAIDSASPPLSAKRQATNRYAIPVIARALGTPGVKGDLDAKALLDNLIDQHLVAEELVPIKRGRGRGSQERLGLVLTGAGRALAGISPPSLQTPQSPQSPLSPTEADRGEAARLALQGDASVAWGGVGGSEAGVQTEADNHELIEGVM